MSVDLQSRIPNNVDLAGDAVGLVSDDLPGGGAVFVDELDAL